MESNNLQKSPLDILKNKAYWRIEKGEVAHYLSPSYFSNIEQVSGLVIQEGATAVICIDGRQTATIPGGCIEFVSKEAIDAVLQQRDPNGGFFSNISHKILNAIGRMLHGEKIGDRISRNSDKPLNTFDDVIKSLRSNSVISAYLVLDSPFAIVYDTVQNAGETSFAPMVIRTKYCDIELGISLMMKVESINDLIRNGLNDKDILTTEDVRFMMRPYVRAIIQEELSEEVVDEKGLTREQLERISTRLLKLSVPNIGIRIVGVGEISIADATNEHFRNLATELYRKEKEIDYLIRSNEFKNRLAAVNNEQKINDAGTELKLMKCLDEINYDRLLHDEEKDAFYTLLSRQRRIRNAKNDSELRKALNDIKKTDILSDDEFDLLQEEIETKRIDRNNIALTMRQQSISTHALATLKIQQEVLRAKLKEEADTEEVKWDNHKREMLRKGDETDINEILYGKQYELDRKQLERSLELDNIRHRNENESKLDDVRHANEILTINLQGQRLSEEYRLERERQNATFTDERNEAARLKNKQLEEDKLDIIRRKQELALRGLQEMHNWDKEEQKAAREFELERMRLEKEEREKFIQMEYEASMTQIDVSHKENMARLENERNYSGEQLFASRIAPDGKAAEIYAESFTSRNALSVREEAERKIEEERRRLDEERRRIYEVERMRGDDVLNKVIDLAKTSMDNSVRVSTGINEAQRESNRENADRIERVAIGRINREEEIQHQRYDDVRETKEEYRRQMMHEQERHDKHQDTALNYTSRTPAKVPVTNAAPEQVVYRIEGFDGVSFTLQQVKSLIKNGIVDLTTTVSCGDRCGRAMDIAELRATFENNDNN